MRGDEGNRHQKLGLKRIICVSQFTIPDIARTIPDPAGKTTDTRSSKPNPACPTRDFSYPRVSFVSFPLSSLISHPRPSSQNTKLSHPALSPHAMFVS